MYGITLICIIFLLSTFSTKLFADETEALEECGNVLHTDIHLLNDPHARFSNNGCHLDCYEGTKLFSSNHINEGFPCPTNKKGKCENGQCIDASINATNECGKIHHFDFNHVNNTGTTFLNDLCTLRCAIAGDVISTNPLYEGKQCPGRKEGVCHNGKCFYNNGSHNKIQYIDISFKTSWINKEYYDKERDNQFYGEVWLEGGCSDFDCRSFYADIKNQLLTLGNSCTLGGSNFNSSDILNVAIYSNTGMVGKYNENMKDFLAENVKDTKKPEIEFRYSFPLSNNEQKPIGKMNLGFNIRYQ